MYWFLLVGGITLFGLIMALVAIHLDWDFVGEAGMTFLIVGAVALICMGLSLINKQADFNATIADYENTVALVETYQGTDYGNMNALTEKIISINEKIASHKARSKSKWSSIWFSEEIGNLKPIVYGRKPAAVTETPPETE